MGWILYSRVAQVFKGTSPTLWLRGRAGIWVLLPAALALVAFVALLALHPTASGRVYAATAIAWLWLVEGVRPTPWDLAGSAVALAGMLIIVWGWRQGG